MGELTAEQERAIDADLERAMAEPMPRELHERIRSLIEPHTINMEIKHRDVMECIDVAYPVICDWLAGHGPAAPGG